jgi:hypothetical protein
LNRARRVEHQRRFRQPADQRRGREHAQADHEHEPAAEPVGQRAAGQQQPGETERIGVDHPLQVGEAGVERALDVRQRGVDDRDVEQQHERRDADRKQCPPLLLHGGREYGQARVP